MPFFIFAYRNPHLAGSVCPFRSRISYLPVYYTLILGYAWQILRKGQKASSLKTFTGKTRNDKHTVQAEGYYFSITEMPRFGSKHRRDSLTSWFACMCASILNAANLGFSVSFGVMLPALMKEFHESRQQTGESHFESGVIKSHYGSWCYIKWRTKCLRR